MSHRPDGLYRCDRCDRDVGNASVDVAAMVSDLVPGDSTSARRLHFCRVPNPGAPHGCAAHVLSPANTTAYRKAQP